MQAADNPAASPGTNSAPIAAAAREWQQWRGPLATGVAPHADPPVHWSETEGIRWKTAIPGKGHSSPIVAGGRVYLTTAIPVGAARAPVYDQAPGSHDNVGVTHTHQFAALALERTTGAIVWQRILREDFPHEGGHVTGSLASNSPVSDGERVYAFFGSRGLYALDLEGRTVWQRDFGRMQTLHAHGEGSSPVVYRDSLIVCWDHEADSALYLLDKRTGKERWKVTRDEKTSWSTPLVVEQDGKPQIVVSATKRVRAYDWATGKLLWECAGLSRNVVSSPVAGQGLVFAANSYDWQALLAIRVAGAQGDITDTPQVAWKMNRLTPYVSSPLLTAGTLYFLRHNQNVLSRHDPHTGNPKGEPLRIEGIREIFASPIAAAGRLYITGRDGVTVVLRDSPANERLALNRLEDRFSASPAAADKELYLRGERFLYCLAPAPNASGK